MSRILGTKMHVAAINLINRRFYLIVKPSAGPEIPSPEIPSRIISPVSSMQLHNMYSTCTSLYVYVYMYSSSITLQGILYPLVSTSTLEDLLMK